MVPFSRRMVGEFSITIYNLTADEKKEMHDELYGLSAYPRKYVDRPRALRERLKENKSILKERQKQAKNNDGKFSVKEKVGF